MKKLVVAVSTLCLTAALAAQRPAPTAPPRDDTPRDTIVTASGCVENGVEAKCFILRDRKTGDLYNLYFEGKPPKAYTGINFQGKPWNGMTYCMQGKPIAVQKWTPNDMACAPSKSNFSPATPGK